MGDEPMTPALELPGGFEGLLAAFSAALVAGTQSGR